MLKLYMTKSKHQRLHPFARPNVIGDIWQRARKRAAAKTGNKALLNVPLKGLRNLSGLLFWEKIPDTFHVRMHMGHKKLDTTDHYLRALINQMSIDPEYDVKAAKTLEERMKLVESGYEKKDEIDGIAIYRKRK
jgi:hypothetical protein